MEEAEDEDIVYLPSQDAASTNERYHTLKNNYFFIGNIFTENTCSIFMSVSLLEMYMYT
jgi:hypothetical protein